VITPVYCEWLCTTSALGGKYPDDKPLPEMEVSTSEDTDEEEDNTIIDHYAMKLKLPLYNTLREVIYT